MPGPAPLPAPVPAAPRAAALRTERRALVLWGLQARGHQRTLDGIEAALAPFGLTVMEFDVLAHIGAAGPASGAAGPGLTQQQLSERLLVTKGNVTYQLTKLEGRGLLTRLRAGPCNHLRLTPAGEALVTRAVPQLRALHVRQYAPLSEAEQLQLAALLRKMAGADTSLLIPQEH